MKLHPYLLAASLAFGATGAFAAPFLAVGDGAELFVTGQLSIASNDNVMLSSANQVSDTVYGINPGLDLVFGKGSLTQGHLGFVENITRYGSNSSLNTELPVIDFSSKYDDGKTQFSTHAGYQELNQNTVDARSNNLVRSNVTDLSATGEFGIAPKSRLGVSADYNNTDYVSSNFNDLSTFTIPVTYYYATTPKVDLSAGIRYRNNTLQGGPNSTDLSYLVGFRGKFTPKLNGSVQVGYGQRDFSGGTLADGDLFAVNASLNYAVTAKTTFQLNVSNDFGYDSVGNQQKNFTVGGVLTSNISEVLSVSASLSTRSIEYLTRTDHFTAGSLGLNYTVNHYLTLTASYNYSSNSSDLAPVEFDNNIFSLSASFRY